MKWREQEESGSEELVSEVYGYPYKRFHSVLRFIPFLPNFRSSNIRVEHDNTLDTSNL